MNCKLPITYMVVLFCFLSNSQNLLDTSTWTVGSGSVTGFTQNGPTSENIRELGYNHIGEQVVLWKAIPGADGGQSGGWNTSYLNINHTKTYRLTVWLKKTNSHDGNSYLGCNSYNNILELNGSVNNNPYFWVGDLPKLDRWYLLVGYVHGSSYSSSVSLGRIYDGVTGEETAINVKDFKFKDTAIHLRHRSYLYYDSNVDDRQYFFDPRIEVVNGGQPSVSQLLRLNPNSKLFLTYDDAGNQTQRLYCPDGNECVPTFDSKQSQEHAKEGIVKTESTEVDSKALSRSVMVHPNPTKGLASIEIQSELHSKIEFIKIYNANSSLLQEFDTRDLKQELRVDLSGKPSGIYFVHIHFNDGSDSVTKKIIKE